MTGGGYDERRIAWSDNELSVRWIHNQNGESNILCPNIGKENKILGDSGKMDLCVTS